MRLAALRLQTLEDRSQGPSDRDPREFLNTRNELYRTMKMAENPPAPAEAIRLMAKNPNLIRRPIVVRGRDAVLGFDEKALLRLVGSPQKRFITR